MKSKGEVFKQGEADEDQGGSRWPERRSSDGCHVLDAEQGDGVEGEGQQVQAGRGNVGVIDIIDGVFNDVLSQVFKNIKSHENLPFENEILKIPPI